MGGGAMSAGARGYVGRNMRRLSRRTRYFICISDYVDRLVKSYGVPEEKNHRIYCGTDLQVKRQFPSSLREELGIDFDEQVVGTTGIWRPNKGFTYYIAACEIMNKWLPTVKYLLGGKAYRSDYAYGTALWMRGKVLRPSKILEYTGYTPDVGRFMSALDVFVLPSDCEPFGLVLIEAMARGIPVIGTKAGGVPEIITHEETGLLVPPKQPEALAKAIYYLLCYPEKRQQMGDAARLRVEQLFDRCNMVKEYEALYTRIISEKS